jgi:hypothetical protein
VLIPYKPFFALLDINLKVSYSNNDMQESQQLNASKFFCKATSNQRIGAGIVFLAILGAFGILGLAAAGIINLGFWFGPCGFKQNYNLPCPTCGMTTSALAFVKGRIWDSFWIQPAGGLLCIVLVFMAFFAFFIAVFGLYSSFLSRFFAQVKIKYTILIFMIIIAAGWAVTLARALAAKFG